MPEKCCIPGCKTNYASIMKHQGYIQCFRFPKDPIARQSWIRCIPRNSKWEPSYRSVVCIKHFHDEDLDWFEKYLDKNVNKIHKRKKPILRPGALPTIFPDLLTYFTKKANVKKVRRKKKEKKQQDNGNLQHLCENMESKIDNMTNIPVVSISTSHSQQNEQIHIKDEPLEMNQNDWEMYQEIKKEIVNSDSTNQNNISVHKPPVVNVKQEYSEDSESDNQINVKTETVAVFIKEELLFDEDFYS